MIVEIRVRRQLSAGSGPLEATTFEERIGQEPVDAGKGADGPEKRRIGQLMDHLLQEGGHGLDLAATALARLKLVRTVDPPVPLRIRERRDHVLRGSQDKVLEHDMRERVGHLVLADQRRQAGRL